MRSTIFLPLVGALATLANAEYCEKGYKLDSKFELDLSPLKKDFVITRWKDNSTIPTITEIEYCLNPCAPIARPTETSEDEWCKEGTYVCRRSINFKKDGKEPRILYKFEIAGDYDNTLNAKFTSFPNVDDASKGGAQFSLILHGGKMHEKDQTTNITLECDTETSRDSDPNPPTFVSHENGVLALFWKTPHVCGKSLMPPDQSGSVEVMSGVNIFFLTFAVVAGLYFGLGALYNRQAYNAKGWDLIPHRDFWQDLPGLIKDLVMHVYESLSSRTRGGYVSV